MRISELMPYVATAVIAAARAYAMGLSNGGANEDNLLAGSREMLRIPLLEECLPLLAKLDSPAFASANNRGIPGFVDAWLSNHCRGDSTSAPRSVTTYGPTRRSTP